MINNHMHMKRISWIIGALVLILCSGIVAASMLTTEVPALDTRAAPSTDGTVSLVVEGSNTETIAISEGDTVLDALVTAALPLETKEYAGLGTLVTSMNGRANGEDGKYWQYTVNGVMPQVSADAYVLTPHDQVVWTFTALP